MPAPEEVRRERADEARAVVTVTQDRAVLEPAVLVRLALVYDGDKALAVAASPLFQQGHQE